MTEHRPFGKAQFATLGECDAAGLTCDDPHGLPLGFLVQAGNRATRRALTYAKHLHTLIIGLSGCGKSTRILAVMLLRAGSKRSFFVVDPKGELAAITAPWRRKCGDVFIINPDGVLSTLPGYEDLKSCGCNPLRDLDPNTSKGTVRASLIADALIPMEGNQPFFPRMARTLLAVCIMLESLDAIREGRQPSLARVRDMLTNLEGLPKQLARAAQSSIRALSNKAQVLMQESKSMRDVKAEAASNTEFLDDAELAADLEKPGCDFARMKDRATTIYLITPADKMERWAPWQKMVCAQALQAVMTPRQNGQLVVTYLLDEYFLLASGGLRVFEQAWAYVRGFGVQLVPILQDINQLMILYKNWQTFVANAGIVLHVGPPNDQTTAEWISKRAGDTTATTEGMTASDGMSWSVDQEGNFKPSNNLGGGTSYGQTRVPFLTPHGLLNTPEGRVYAFKQGLANVIQADAPLYIDAPLGLSRRARANPYFTA